ncbi:hypothetical protein M0638_26875 [Roseomonas sp. NAR14]|uniref:Uncharacterized protein n=1 Tax=Roseomonas acroporae TaxID=2937791 RepID=A0A9X1YBZ7_9PROT|nr:hypothetical protein [Roseomonas acroporae]MCK8787984.1 hypothetical protein [Roseomonas acroporae]
MSDTSLVTLSPEQARQLPGPPVNLPTVPAAPAAAPGGGQVIEITTPRGAPAAGAAAAAPMPVGPAEPPPPTADEIAERYEAQWYMRQFPGADVALPTPATVRPGEAAGAAGLGATTPGEQAAPAPAAPAAPTATDPYQAGLAALGLSGPPGDAGAAPAPTPAPATPASAGFLERLRGMTQAMAEARPSVAGGAVRDVAQGALDLGSELGQWASLLDRDVRIRLPDARGGTADEVARGLVALAIPFRMTARAMRAAGLGRYVATMAGGAVADMLADPADGNLSTLARSLGVENEVTRLLDSRTGDDAAAEEKLRARLRNVVEGAAAGAAIDGLVELVRASRHAAHRLAQGGFGPEPAPAGMPPGAMAMAAEEPAGGGAAAASRRAVASADDFRTWWAEQSARLARGERPRPAGQTFSVGRIEDDVAGFLAQHDIALPARDILLGDDTPFRMVRASKGVNALAPADVARIPEVLRDPSAIYWDEMSPGLIYAFDRPGSDRTGKLIVRVGFDARDFGRVNMVRSGSGVPLRSLEDPNHYTVIRRAAP